MYASAAEVHREVYVLRAMCMFTELFTEVYVHRAMETCCGVLFFGKIHV